jgi:hypothetical protein
MRVPGIWPGLSLGKVLIVPAILSLAIFASDAVKPVVLVLDLAVAVIALVDLASLRGAGWGRASREWRPRLLAGGAQAGHAAHREPGVAGPARSDQG